MSYIGTPPSNAFTSLLKQDFSTSATTGYTLDHAVNNANDIALFINFVRQEPTAGYAASGTSLVLTSATASSDDMYCVYLGQALQTVNPANASVGTSQLVDGAVTSAKLASGVGGKVLQVVSTPKTDTFSTSSTSFTDITGLSVAITPSATSSKILVMMDVMGGSGTNISMFLRLMRNTTAIHVGTDVGNRIASTAGASDDPSDQFAMSMTGTVLDSPSSTSEVTYKVQMSTEGSGNTGTCFINRSGEDSNSNQGGRYTSSITVMEIAG